MTMNDLYTGPVLLAAGGTGGHMFPAQALAEELKRRHHQVILITDARGMRYVSQFPANNIIEIPAANPNARGIGGKVIAALSMTGGLIRSLQEIRRHKPIAAVGFGGYPSLPGMQAAHISRIPYGVHEQNSQLGRANRFLGRSAQFMAHAFPVLAGVPANLTTPRCEVGNPVRDDVQKLAGSAFHVPQEGGAFRILITGGSQGASLLAKVPVDAIAALPNHLRTRLEVVHQIREEDQADARHVYDKAGVKVEVAAFFDDLPERIANSHLLIARAGASTVTEIATIGRPAIFVPLGIAMDDHQTMNARVLSEADAAILMPEKEFTDGALRNTLERLMTTPRTLVEMADVAKSRVKSGAAAAMADLVDEMIEKSK